ncbi:MAG: response regulator transcription factor [Oscillospiraceae bacterium]|nr:response regulator transcription factor [Oscillospiraceae bacterium]
MKKILFCEDEATIRDFVVINLERAGYSVYSAESGEEALEMFEEHSQDFDLALLDIMLPNMDGFTVCKKLREKSDKLGIIMLTAKTQEMDKVNGLMLGADDYVIKPFSPSELVARVDAVYRRVNMIGNSNNPQDMIMTTGIFTLNRKTRILTKNDVPVDLTQIEYQIMELFMSSHKIALSRAQIMSSIWGDGYFGDIKIVDVNIRRLRMKLEDSPSTPSYILTIWGFGYKWDA